METNIEEIWKDVVGYEGRYMISNFGNVVNKKGIKLSPNIRRNYLSVRIYKNKIGQHHVIHRLVAFAFLDLVPEKDMVNHKDCNKLNNHVDNLEWCTLTENRRHAYRAGRHGNSSKLIDRDKMDRVLELRSKGYKQHEIGKMFNVTQSVISRILSQGRGYKNVYNKVVI